MKQKTALGYLAILFVIVLKYSNLAEYCENLDCSYVIFYNHYSHFFKTQPIIFTYGPLGFLRSTLNNGLNDILGFLFHFLIKSLVAFSSFIIFSKSTQSRKIAFLLVVSFLVFLELDISIAILGLLLYKSKEFLDSKVLQVIVLAIISVIFTLALHIKFSIGLTFLALLLPLVIYDLYQKRLGLATFLGWTFFTTFIVLIVANFFFGNFIHFYQYINGTFILSSAYAASLSLHPLIHKFGLLVAIFIWVYLAFYYLSIDWGAKISMLLGLLIVAKHALVREDFYHNTSLVEYYFFSVLLVTLVYRKSYTPKPIFVGFIGFFALISYNVQLGSYAQHLSRHTTFSNIFKMIKRNVHTHTQISNSSRFDLGKYDEILNKQSVDIYPTELSIAFYNQLHYDPRINLQSIDFNPELDSLSAQHFSKIEKPKFIIWHNTIDRFNNKMAGIEDRYILNAEPKTIQSIIENYEIVETENEYVILRARIQSQMTKHFETPEFDFSLGEMIEVPTSAWKIKADVDLNNWGKLISSVYKEPAFYLRLVFDDQSEVIYNINRKNAISGIWLNPFLTSLQSSEVKKVDSLGIYCKSEFLAKKKIQSSWFVSENIDNVLAQFYGKEINKSSQLYFDIEESKTISIQNVKPFITLFERSFAKSDNISAIKIKTKAFVDLKPKSKPRLVFHILNSGQETMHYEALYFDDFYALTNFQIPFVITRVINIAHFFESQDTIQLKAYFWNEGKGDFYIKDTQTIIRFNSNNIISKSQ